MRGWPRTSDALLGFRPNLGRPRIEAAHRGTKIIGRVGEFLDPRSQLGESTMEAGTNGRVGDAQNVSDLARLQPFDVVEFERDLEIERKSAQGEDEQAFVVALTEQRRGRRSEVVHAHLRNLALAPVLATKVLEHDVARGSEQIRAETGLRTQAFAPLDAGQECLLHEVFGGVADLAANEAKDGIEVALEQDLAGSRVAFLPRSQEFEVVVFQGIDDNRHSLGNKSGPIPTISAKGIP